MIFTIGHSNHPIERFVALLQQQAIDAVADVRSAPYSRFNPQFNRKALLQSLAAADIEYVFLGEQLGARTSDRTCYENGRVSYDRLARTALFKSGIDRLLAGMTLRRIAMMCAEKEPLDCHRTILVARELRRRGVRVAHILASGELETHECALDRLRRRLGIEATDLFRGEEQANEEAYAAQGGQIAYVDPIAR